MPELTDSQRTALENAASNLEVSKQIDSLSTNTPGEHADKWRFASTQVDVLLEMRTRVALLPTDGTHAQELAETLASLDREITESLGSLRTLSAYSGATNDEKIAQLKTIQSLADRHAGMDVPTESREAAVSVRNNLQSEIFTRQSPGFAQLVLAPSHPDYQDQLEACEMAIQARRNMGQIILQDANSVLNREPDPATIKDIKEKTLDIQSRTKELTSAMSLSSMKKAQEEMNRIRMGSSDTIQGKSGGGEKEGGANQAMQNWLEASQRATEFAQTGLPITLEQIRELNQILNKNMPANDGVPGEFRSKTETAGGGSQYPYPEHVPQMMEEFTQWFEENQHRDPIELAGLSYQKLVSIHPFDDANGRTCRLVVDSILQSKGLPPASYEGTEVNLAVFGVPQGGKTNMTPDEAIQIVGTAVERSLSVIQKHSLTVSVREELENSTVTEKQTRIEEGLDLQSPPLQVGDVPVLQEQQAQGDMVIDPLTDDTAPDLAPVPVPLTVPQQQEVERIRRDFAQIAISIDESTVELNKANPLTKMATGGTKPDLSKFSDAELGIIYDQLVRSPSLNRLSDGYEEGSSKKIGEPHRSCFTEIADRGVQTGDIPREELEEGINDVLAEVYGYDLDPMLIAEAQNMTTNGRGAEIDGRMVNVILSIEKLEEVTGRKMDELQDVKDSLPQAKLDAKAFNKFTEQKMANNVQIGMQTKLDQFAVRGGVKAAEVREFFESSRQRMDASGMAGGNSHLAKMEKVEVDLKGMNFNGLDLSEADLSGFKIDPRTLSMAEGLNKVKGVDVETLEAATHLKKEMEKQVLDRAQVQPDLDKLAKLQTRMEKLSQNKPPLGERFKAMFTKGGIEGLKSEVAAQIEKTKLDIVSKVDAVQLGARMDANADRLQKIENQQAQHAPGALAYIDTKQKFEQRHGEFAVEMLSNNGQMTPKAEQLLEETQMLKQEMERHEGAYNSYNELSEKMKGQQKVVDHGENVKSVRESLGNKDTEVEAPKQSRSVKI